MINIFLSQSVINCGEIFNKFKNKLVSWGMDKDKASEISKTTVLYGLMSGSSVKEIKLSTIAISQMYVSSACHQDDINNLLECSPYLMNDFAKFHGVEYQSLRHLELTINGLMNSICLNSKRLVTEVSTNKAPQAMNFLKLIEFKCKSSITKDMVH